MDIVKWGIIGCGDVAEKKSGPAFQNVKNSELVAVMRRNAIKAEDFARRHGVSLWYDNAEKLLDNPEINAVYIATPPSSHLELAISALNKGKHVYLEKPMVLDAREAEVLSNVAKKATAKLTIAHYRRQLPAFLKVKSLLDKNVIGDVRFVDLKTLQSPQADIIAKTDENWRINPEISGGGYFYDLAPHQIDLMCMYFGNYKEAVGTSVNQSLQYQANDLVTGIIHFANDVICTAKWCFNIHKNDQKDQCKIYGSKGTITFSFYGDKVMYESDDQKKVYEFESPKFIQYPMIDATVQYFLGQRDNPCTVQDGETVINIMEAFTK